MGDMDADMQAQEEARAREARQEMLSVMGPSSNDSKKDAAPSAGPTEGDKEKEDEDRRAKWRRPDSKGGKGSSHGGWNQSWSAKRQWHDSAQHSSGDQAPVMDQATQDLLKNMVRVVLRHETEIQRFKQDVGFMVFIDTSGLGCLSNLRAVADNWQEQYAQGKVRNSLLKLLLFLAMMEMLKNKAEETLQDEERLQRCMNVGWTVQGETALSPAWVYHAWDPASRKQIVAETPPMKHSEALRQIDLLIQHSARDGVLKNFKTAKKMSATDTYKVEVLPFMVSIGLRGESSQICFHALRALSGLAITKLIGARFRPERGQETQLVKQMKESYMGTTYCDWARREAPWNSDA